MKALFHLLRVGLVVVLVACGDGWVSLVLLVDSQWVLYGLCVKLEDYGNRMKRRRECWWWCWLGVVK